MSGRVLLALVGVVLVGLALLLAPTPPVERTSTLTALGQSMGGLRVGLVDLLFLRAERLTREGRVDQVPGLYKAVLDLDPENALAVDYLVAVYAYDLRIESNDPKERIAWWRRALSLLEEGLERHPVDASLHVRMSDLLLEIPADDEILREYVARTRPDAQQRAIEHLFEAARLVPSLRRRGREHLFRLALLGPVWAWKALQQDHRSGPEGVAALLSTGREILGLREAAYGEMSFPLGPPGTDGPSVVSMRDVFADGLRVVELYLQGDPGAADTAAAFVADYPEAPLAEQLRRARDD